MTDADAVIRLRALLGRYDAGDPDRIALQRAIYVLKYRSRAYLVTPE